MAKALQNAVMTRSRLQNIYLNNQNAIDWNYNKYQRTFCTNLKNKILLFLQLNVVELNDKKKIWKKSTLFFRKYSKIEKITFKISISTWTSFFFKRIMTVFFCFMAVFPKSKRITSLTKKMTQTSDQWFLE